MGSHGEGLQARTWLHSLHNTNRQLRPPPRCRASRNLEKTLFLLKMGHEFDAGSNSNNSNSAFQSTPVGGEFHLSQEWS